MGSPAVLLDLTLRCLGRPNYVSYLLKLLYGALLQTNMVHFPMKIKRGTSAGISEWRDSVVLHLLVWFV